MRVNNMDMVNEIKKDNSGYYLGSVGLAFVCFVILSILGKLGVVLFDLAVKYWWGCLIFLVLWFFFRKRGRKG